MVVTRKTLLGLPLTVVLVRLTRHRDERLSSPLSQAHTALLLFVSILESVYAPGV